MRCNFWQTARQAMLVLGGLVLLPVNYALGVTQTESFQNGVNGYNGTFDRRISSDAFGDSEHSNGADSAAYFFDGFNGVDSDDTQGLIRFDNIIGNGAGQIPSGATILDAKLTLTTSLAGNAQTSGPWGVSGLLQAVSPTTNYFDFTSSTDHTSRGAWWQDGSATRPTGGYGFQLPGAPDSANVTPIVQSWASGAPAHGFVIQSGLADSVTVNANTADGWSIHTTGFPTSDTRPKLEVTYTTDAVEVNTFQRGLNGYNSDTMAIVRSGFNALNPDTGADPPEITEDASTLDQTFLDGVFFDNTTGDTSSSDDFALLQFDNVFGNGQGQAPSDEPVAKAWAVITTGDTSANANSSGPYTAHTMLRPWDTTSLHSSFGDVDGLQVGDGDISPALDSQDGMIRGGEVWFDITDYLEGVRNGETDNGIALLTTGTADGWQIHTNGSSDASARPRLVVYSADPGISPVQPGDFDGDGDVDGADFVVWQTNFPTQDDATLATGDADGDGDVDGADFVIWQTNFPFTPSSGSSPVPEPATWLLGLVAATLLVSRRAMKY